MIQPVGIDHVVLLVSSLERAESYYGSLFDFVISKRPSFPNILIVESPAAHFFLQEAPNAPISFLRQQHISFAVESVDELAQFLTEQGISFKTGATDFMQSWDYRWCEWRDPDGIRLEGVERLPAP